MQTSIGQAAAFGTGPLPASAESTSGSNSSTTGTTSSATVTANDFLELLVTEMKNQDPTANTDPNEYISQLVQVNSLEQLVQINQDLGSSASASDGASGSSVNAPAAGVAATAQDSAAQKVSAGSAPAASPSQSGITAAAARVADSLQFPSEPASATNPQNFIRRTGTYPGAARINPGTAR